MNKNQNKGDIIYFALVQRQRKKNKGINEAESSTTIKEVWC